MRVMGATTVAMVAMATWIGKAGATTKVLSTGKNWANLAWGFRNGGLDVVGPADMVLVDPDFAEDDYGSGYIGQLSSNAKTVYCYLSAGTIEGYRQDYKDNKAAWDELALGKMAAWDESWVDIRKLSDLMPLVEIRLDKLVAKGCQGVEPDNIDCYDNRDCWGRMAGVSSGISVKAAQIAYNRALADAVHARGMKILQKNAVDITDDLIDKFDGAITENCLFYNECGPYQAYIAQNKPHYATEYWTSRTLCKRAAKFPSMQTKYCKANRGKYLCTRSRKQKTWLSC